MLSHCSSSYANAPQYYIYTRIACLVLWKHTEYSYHVPEYSSCRGPTVVHQAFILHGSQSVFLSEIPPTTLHSKVSTYRLPASQQASCILKIFLNTRVPANKVNTLAFSLLFLTPQIRNVTNNFNTAVRICFLAKHEPPCLCAHSMHTRLRI